MDISNLTLDELTNGFHRNHEQDCVCNYCGRTFPQGQVFSVGGSFYMPETAVVKHIETEHGGNFAQLLQTDTRYNTMTGKQKELLALFHSGLSDNEVARRQEVTTSTVRHQKFTFREKAKQARFYLALFEHVFGGQEKSDEAIVPIHDHAVYYDDRYVITEQEKNQILKTSFASLAPLRLNVFSPKEKKKVVILGKITELFEPGRTYSEKEINELLKPVYDDYIILRRYLVMYGFMRRDDDGTNYRLT